MQKTIVTGCSGQLGSRIVTDLLSKGHHVVGLDVTTPKNIQHRASFEFHQVDLRARGEVEAFFSNLRQNHLHIDSIVNNAGTAVFSKFEDRTEEELQEVIQLNMMAPIFMIQGFLEMAKPNYESSIVNIASIYGIVAPDQSLYTDTPRNSSEIYGMTKAATINLTQYLSVYLADRKIRVNCVSPGGVQFRQGPEFIKAYSAKVPMARMA